MAKNLIQTAGRRAGLLLGLAFALARPAVGGDLESGQWKLGSLSSNAPGAVYFLFAESNETVIVRVANEDEERLEIPDLAVSYEDRSTNPYTYTPVGGWSARNNMAEMKLAITNRGWYFLFCTLPASLATYSNTLEYSASALVMPDPALTVDDLDVGPLHNGQNLLGTIDVGADLDAAVFPVESNSTVQIRMTQRVTALVPSLTIYDPAGAAVTNDYPPEYRSEITATLTNPGIYTVVLNDAFKSRGAYSVSLAQIGREPVGEDLDLGPIISGETKSGRIAVPGDLDIALFSGLAGDRVLLSLAEAGPGDTALNPVVELFGPDGALLARGKDVFQECAVISNQLLAADGRYTVICKDAYDRSEVGYVLTMEFLPGSPSLILNKPAAPTGLVASDGAYADHILVSWTASPSTNVTGYDLWRSLDGIAFAQIATNRSATTYQDFSVASNTPYYYKAAARNAAAISEFSGADSGYRGAVLPAAPASVSASDGAFPDHILITWSAGSATNVTGYDVWRKSWTNAYVRLASNWSGQAYEDGGAAPNLVYAYRVQARNPFGAGAFSPEDTGYCGSTNVSSARRALLVGLDRYDPAYGPGNLDTCVNDAYGIRNVLLLGDPAGRWPEAALHLAINGSATKQAIRSRLFQLAAASGPGDLTLYYHSGHGGQSDGANPSNTFLCAYDADYTDAELGADLALFQPDARVVVVLDACFSYGMAQSAGGAPAAAPWSFPERVLAYAQRAQAQRYARLGLAAPKVLGTNIAFMTASDVDEYSWTSTHYSLYTRFLIDGCSLRLPDTDRNGRYDFLELHTYAGTQAVRLQPTQHAQTLNPALLAALPVRNLPPNPQALHAVHNDFTGDGASDLAVYHPGTGRWRIKSTDAIAGWWVFDHVWGAPGFAPIDGDYDGDGKSDPALYSAAAGEWRVLSSRNRYDPVEMDFGGPDLIPAAGDYDGDGRSDAALYQQPDGYWYIIANDEVGRHPALIWGESYTGAWFIPVSGDFDGDRISDLALYHTPSGAWYIGSRAGGVLAWGVVWGGPDFRPVSGDYDADGASDLAVYQPATGAWFIRSLQRGLTLVNGTQAGGPDCVPVAGDYDGDGFYDLAVYQPATGFWFFRTADGSRGFDLLEPVGGPGWMPVQPVWSAP